MKRFLSGVLATLMLCSVLAGCGESESNATERSSASSTIEHKVPSEPITVKDGTFDMTVDQFIKNVNSLAGFKCVEDIESWNVFDDGTALVQNENIRVSLNRTKKDVGVLAVLIAQPQDNERKYLFDVVCTYAIMACGGINYSDEAQDNIVTALLKARVEGEAILTVGNASCFFSVRDEEEHCMIIAYDSETSTETPTAAPESTQEVPQTTANTATIGQKNALAKAKDYLAFTAFSYSGLIEQLEYEGFSTEEATYGADNCGADWNEQAAQKAKDYLDFMSFSRSGLIDQLLYEGFTQEQAEYGATAAGY